MATGAAYRSGGRLPGRVTAEYRTNVPPRTSVLLRYPSVTLSYDDPTTPLHQVTFCVVDLETTGASSATCAITEVGAAKFRGGECLGTFQTLVDSGVPVSPVAARITGITDEMISGAPPLPGVLAALGEFA